MFRIVTRLKKLKKVGNSYKLIFPQEVVERELIKAGNQFIISIKKANVN